MRRWLAAMLTIGLLGFCVPSVTHAQAPTELRVNRALLIGVDDFVSRESIYPSSTNNAFAMQEAFQASLVPFETILLPDMPVTSAEALTTLIRETFAGAKESDASYLYISTHGEYNPDKSDEPALLLSDGWTEGRITAAELEAAFKGIAGTKVLLLDACNSGAFIGKGMPEQPANLHFQSPSFKVLTSSGALEESWYWNASDEETPGELQGAFYFTQALSQSLSPACGYPADANSDGFVTLSELYGYLLRNHAASTPQVYPQEDDFIVFAYDPRQVYDGVRSAVSDVTFSSTALSADAHELTLEYIAARPVRVAYQIVYQRDGKWRFDEAKLLYDSAERFTAYGDEPGAVSPGRKVRTLSIDLRAGEASGYVLVQLVTIEKDSLTVHAGCVLAVSPSKGDLRLTVRTPRVYQSESSKELAIYVGHAYPCVLSLTIVNAKGDVVRRLCHRQSTRPMQMNGSTFYWDGRDKTGAVVPDGVYRVRVSGLLGELVFTVASDEITVVSEAG